MGGSPVYFEHKRGDAMKLDDADVMTFPKKLVEHTILGLQPPLNRHLVKLAAFDFPPETRRYFRREAENWLGKSNRCVSSRITGRVRRNSTSTCYSIIRLAGSKYKT